MDYWLIVGGVVYVCGVAAAMAWASWGDKRSGAALTNLQTQKSPTGLRSKKRGGFI
jgi:hypothetical protein